MIEIPAAIEKKQNFMADASKKIGEYLLKGWTMLGDNCPHGCNVPLMRSRDGSSLVCYGCDTDFLARAAEVAESTTIPNEKSNVFILAGDGKLRSSLDSKLAWLSTQIESTNSISELHSMVDLANKIIILRKSI